MVDKLATKQRKGITITKKQSSKSEEKISVFPKNKENKNTTITTNDDNLYNCKDIQEFISVVTKLSPITAIRKTIEKFTSNNGNSETSWEVVNELTIKNNFDICQNYFSHDFHTVTYDDFKFKIFNKHKNIDLKDLNLIYFEEETGLPKKPMSAQQAETNCCLLSSSAIIDLNSLRSLKNFFNLPDKKCDNMKIISEELNEIVDEFYHFLENEKADLIVAIYKFHKDNLRSNKIKVRLRINDSLLVEIMEAYFSSFMFFATRVCGNLASDKELNKSKNKIKNLLKEIEEHLPSSCINKTTLTQVQDLELVLDNTLETVKRIFNVSK